MHRVTVTIAAAVMALSGRALDLRRDGAVVAAEAVATEAALILAVSIARAVLWACNATIIALELREAATGAIETYTLSTTLVRTAWTSLRAAVLLPVPLITLAGQTDTFAVLRAVARTCGLAAVVAHPAVFTPAGTVVAIAICTLILAR